VELRQFLSIVRRWLWLIFLTVTVAVGAAYLASQRATPLYRTSATLMVGTWIQSADPNTLDVHLSQTLAETYANLAGREPVLGGAVEALGWDIDWRSIAGQVSVSAVPRTAFIEVTVVDSQPRRAKALADAVAEQLIRFGPAGASGMDPLDRAFSQESVGDLRAKIIAAQDDIGSLQEQVDAAVSARRIQELNSQIAVLEAKVADWASTYSRLLLALEGSDTNVVTVLEEAVVPTWPISPDTPRNMLVSGAGALALAVAAIVLIEYLDDTVKSPQDIDSVCGLPTLGGIARIGGRGYKAKLVVVNHPLSPVSEAYRIMRTNLEFSSIDTPIRKILVTSPGPSQGKSVTLANLGAVMAQSGRRVVAVDTDLRRPVLHKVFDLSNDWGLTEALMSGDAGVAEHLQSTSVENLSVLTSGALPPNPSEVLGSQRMEVLVDELARAADVVLFDSPPSLAVADPTILATLVDGTVMVCDAGRTRRGDLERAASELRRVGAKLLGAVLNQLPARRGGYYTYYGHYSYKPRKSERRKRRSRERRKDAAARRSGQPPQASGGSTQQEAPAV
jgi:non-specific protein-tyrosine kinase